MAVKPYPENMADKGVAKKWEPELGAGGVVYRLTDEGPEIVLIMPNKHNEQAPTGRWRLPKGMIEAGEKPERTAEREVFEETGIRGRAEADLGEEKFFYSRDGRNFIKTVKFYLLRYESGEPRPDPLEVNEVQWMPILKGIEMLHYPAEKEVAAKALHLLMRELPSA